MPVTSVLVSVDIPEGYEVVGFGILEEGELFLSHVGPIAAGAMAGAYGLKLRKKDNLDTVKAAVKDAVATCIRYTQGNVENGATAALPSTLTLVKLLRDLSKISAANPEGWAEFCKADLMSLKRLVTDARASV